ncbi:hypothetical protein SLA2020_011760 [Shorea laevis]
MRTHLFRSIYISSILLSRHSSSVLNRFTSSQALLHNGFLALLLDLGHSTALRICHRAIDDTVAISFSKDVTVSVSRSQTALFSTASVGNDDYSTRRRTVSISVFNLFDSYRSSYTSSERRCFEQVYSCWICRCLPIRSCFGYVDCTVEFSVSL